ncbi:MAG: hypothetical protein KFB93_05925 [Simkaniaceae bacterium]|jgi:hypothetical protein|nr:MAG: hypothetical protein KFB93_05925 [Simkaniaceae bacterium]
MKKMILVSLLAFSSLFADYYHNRPQMLYSEHQAPKASYILGSGQHEMRGKSPDGIIELEDGTQFKAISRHRQAMEYWNFYDRITFCPNPYPFGGSEFYVVNESNGEYFKADIWASPAVENPHTFRLSHIDREYQEIVLVGNQGMKIRWKIDPEDFDYLRYWKRGDAIVVGKNSNWFSSYFSDYEFILVSYSATEDILYVRANPKPL